MIVTRTATLPELVWVVTTALALLFGLVSIGASLMDYLAARARGENGPIEESGRNAIRRELMRFLVLLCVLILGVDVALRDVAATEWRAQLQAGIAVLCWLDQLGDWVSRKQLDMLIRRYTIPSKRAVVDASDVEE